MKRKPVKQEPTFNAPHMQKPLGRHYSDDSFQTMGRTYLKSMQDMKADDNGQPVVYVELVTPKDYFNVGETCGRLGIEGVELSWHLKLIRLAFQSESDAVAFKLSYAKLVQAPWKEFFP